MTDEIGVMTARQIYEKIVMDSKFGLDRKFVPVERIEKLIEKVKNKNIVYIDISGAKVSWAVIDREIELLEIVLNSLLK